ncbi:hypothetical protein BN7_3820 [Wickerhamomyces ciferrii]|uniref:Uncharacterized protein n=1 Tax=Wickerhamomyces ciferrii (strain ATCC 14091 / BCRC 22168 / CBS 111 / JCM 3599 / NBRC 0793 / NRRL Y-1031 F-60-10) TaxID=1206466 RepID=K0KSG6_WICCF|nr:uncharacterized protein BN7_3820 [Wickerhamomyces ciferrii]CCH44259.1 hypothetical protein BN7_3820 [Wickerhamomyces ciferrii]
MSNFKTQLNQLIAAQLKQSEQNPGQQADLKTKVASALPLAERYERLFRTTEFNDVADVVTPLENSSKLTNKVQEYADRVFKNIEALKSTFDDPTLLKFNKSKAELFITKMQLSIQENDIQMAKFYEERADLTVFATTGESDVVFESLRVIYNSSLSLYNQKRIVDAIYFLNKAAGHISSMGSNSSEDFKRIKPSIYSLLGKNGDVVEIEDLIMRMLMSIKSSELKEALGLINDFSTRDAPGAIRCFEYAFNSNTEKESDHNVIELIIVAIVNIYIKDDTNLSEYKQQNLVSFLDTAQKKLAKALSRKCAASCITLLWNTGKTCTKNSSFEDSLGWFKLALHSILDINEIDKAKIQRAIQNSYINLERYDEAIKVYKTMDDKEKYGLISQYNMFKVYSSKGDEMSLMSCLKRMTTSEDKNLIPLLSLCATNVQSSTRVAVESMLALFKKIDTGIDNKVSIPTSLRCVIEMILKQDDYLFKYSETLLTILREAYKFANDSKTIESYKFTIEEIQWFSAQAFNISRDCVSSSDTAARQQFELKLWRFRAMLITLICTSKDQNLDADIRWKEIRSQSLNLRLSIEELTIISETQAEYDVFRKEWEQCLVDCMIFQFQAEFELEHWSAAETIIRESRKLTTQEFDTTVVNITSENTKAPESIKSNILTEILQRNLGDPEISAVKISRWIRLLLKYNGSGIEADSNSLKIIQQIYLRISSQKEDNQFPAHEIEWISTTCWNNGIGALFNADKVQGRLWCDRAIKLAGFVNERFEAALLKLWKELQHMAE